MSDKQYTLKEVSTHTGPDNGGLWLVIENDVFDVSGFVDEHPGGAKILKRVAGKDATKQFWKYHNEGVLKKFKPKLCIGTVKEEAKL